MGAPEAASYPRGRGRGESQSPPDAAGRRAARTVLLVVFVDLLGFGVIVPVLPFYVRSFGVSDLFIGLLAAAYSLAQFGAALALLPFAPALGRALPAPGGPVWLTRELLGLLTALTCLSAGNGTLTVALTALVSREADAEAQGVAFGVAQGAGSLGRTLGPPAMAALYVVGYPLPFLAGAALVVPVALALARRRAE